MSHDRRQVRTAANITAAIVAALVFGAGLVFAIGAVFKHHEQSLFADPTKHRTVTTTVSHQTGEGAQPKVTTTITKSSANGNEPAETTTTIVTEKPSHSKETTTTTSEANESLFERGLAGAGFLFFRVALAALAAFLAGAVVQRVLLSDFAIKVGPVEIPGLTVAAEASKTAITQMKESLRRQTSSLGRRLTQIGTKLEKNTETTINTGHLAAETARAVTDLQERVAQLESKAD
jgi:hypothetical protein